MPANLGTVNSTTSIALASDIGSVATDAIWDAAGDLVQGTGANTAARLALGAAGTVVRSTGSTNAYALPPGHEFDYVTKTTDTSITATTEATANTIITGNAVAYDGSTEVEIKFFAANGRPDNTAASRTLLFWLYDGSSSIGAIAAQVTPAAASAAQPVNGRAQITPTAATHTYSVRASVNAGTGLVSAGAGGAGVYVPASLKIKKV